MWQAWIFLILTVILWGTAPIIEKTGLKGADEFTAVFIRSTAIFLIIFVAFGLSGKFSSLAKIPILWSPKAKKMKNFNNGGPY